MNRSFGGRGKSPRGGRGKSPGGRGRGRSPGGRDSFGGGGGGKFRGGGGHQSGDRHKSPFRGGHSHGNRGRGNSKSPHGGNPHKQMTPKMNGKSLSPFKSGDKQATNFKKGKSPGATPRGNAGPPKVKKFMSHKPTGDDDPDDMDEDELNRLLNESDDDDEEDEFDFDDSSDDDDEESDEDSDRPGLTIEEVTDEKKADKKPSKKAKPSEDKEIEALLKKMKTHKKGKQEEDDEDLDMSDEDEDDDDDYDDDEEDDEDEEEAEEEIKKLFQKMKAQAPKKSVEDDDDDDEDEEDEDEEEDDDEDDEEIQKLLEKMKAESGGSVKKGMKHEEEEDDEDEEDDDEDDDEEDEDSDDEDEEEVEKLLKKMKQQAEGKPTKKGAQKAEIEESDDEEEDSEEDDEDDEEINKLLKAMRQQADKKQDPQKRGQKRKAEDDDDDDDSDDEDWKPKTKGAGAGLKRPAPQDSSDEEESEDEDEGKSKPSAKKLKMEDDEDEDDDDDDDDEEEEDEDDSDDLEIEQAVRKETEKQAVQAKLSKKRAAPDHDEEFEKLTSKADKLKKAVVSQVKDEDSNDSGEEDETPKAKKSANTPSSGEQKPSSLSERRYLQPTPKVQDPKLRKELFRKINERLQNTLRIRPVPSLIRGEDLRTLCPEATAMRIPWNKLTRRSRRLAFLEFKDKETTQACMEKLKGTMYQKRKLMVDIQNGIGMDAIDNFNTRRLLVQNLPWNINKSMILTHFPKAEFLDILSGGTTDKRMPAVAFVTFKNERDAINAFDKMQGVDIKGRLASVGFQRKPYEFDHNDHKQLVVFGVKKSVREQDMAAIFTRGKSIEMSGKGMAVIHYANHEDCAADFADRRGVRIGGKPLSVCYGSRKFSAAKAESSAAPVTDKKQDTSEKPSEEGLDRKAIFIRGMGQQTQQSDIRSLFPKAVDMFMKMKGKVCYGTATVRFADEEAAAAALQKAASTEIHGRKLIATFFRKFSKQSPGPNSAKQPQKASAHLASKSKPDVEAMNVDKEVSTPADQTGKKKKKKNKNKFKEQDNEGAAANKPNQQKQQQQQKPQQIHKEGQKKKFKGPKPKKAKAS